MTHGPSWVVMACLAAVMAPPATAGGPPGEAVAAATGESGVVAGEQESGKPAPGTASHGAAIYRERGCVPCHSATLDEDARDSAPEASGPIRAGHPLEGAAYRGSWWGGRITTDAAEAADFCLRAWIEPDTEGFSAQERKALVLFMQALGSERGVSPLLLLRRDAGDVDVRGGDPSRGRSAYARACAACHPGGEAEARRLQGGLSPAQVADLIRKGSGRMPFFQVDRLAAAHIADIAAYLDSLRPPPSR